MNHYPFIGHVINLMLTRIISINRSIFHNCLVAMETGHPGGRQVAMETGHPGAHKLPWKRGIQGATKLPWKRGI